MGHRVSTCRHRVTVAMQGERGKDWGNSLLIDVIIIHSIKDLTYSMYK